MTLPKKKKTKTSLRKIGVLHGFRSGLEEKVAEQLKELDIDFGYETKDSIINYEKPVTKHRYTPDFNFGKQSTIIIETKGRFLTADRQKHLLIKKQHPELDIRFVFSNSKSRISKSSKTTYAAWCEKHGFKYADKLIPKDWIKEIKKDGLK